jgi:hypothetical protein
VGEHGLRKQLSDHILEWLSGGIGFKRDDGGSRRRRGHNKREEKSVMANGCERKMIGEMLGGKFIKVNREVK